MNGWWLATTSTHTRTWAAAREKEIIVQSRELGDGPPNLQEDESSCEGTASKAQEGLERAGMEKKKHTQAA